MKPLLRDLPSVDRLLALDQTRAWLARFDRQYITRQCRAALDDIRREVIAGEIAGDSLDDAVILARIDERIRRDADPGLRRVINASGTLLHTNLGRAPLASAAVDAVMRIAAHPSTLEYDLTHGGRGRRESDVARRLTWLTGAEAATVVNNNAAAVLVGVNSLAGGKEVIVSRGELVEIGGAFRIPDIVAKGGAQLREVGTTNRTHPSDYERAIGPNTGAILKVHTSNYRIVGFAADVSLTDLVAIGRHHGIPVMEDLGSGALVDLTSYNLPKEPLVSERVGMGADLVTFSGDKLLGGPQAGLIVGTHAAVESVMANPLHRAVRCDKMTLAALEATLAIYQQSGDLSREIPALALLARSIDDIAEVADQAQLLLRRSLGTGFQIDVEDECSQVGSGALPITELPTRVLAIVHPDRSADQIAEQFRSAHPPIIGRIKNDRFLLDARAVSDPRDLVPGD